MARRKKLSTVQPLLLTIPDVAIQLGVCRGTIYNLIYRQGLPSVMLGSVRRVHPDSLHEFFCFVVWLGQDILHFRRCYYGKTRKTEARAAKQW